MHLPFEGCIVIRGVNFIPRGTQKRIIDIDMVRKEKIIWNCLRSMPRNENIVQWIVSPQVLPCFGEALLMTSMLILLW